MAMALAGTDINQFLLVFLGLAIGVISGFVGVGGGFIMSPALIILGVPAHYAVGTSMLWVTGNAVIGTIRHRQEGNVDIKLGFILMAFIIAGMEAGVRLLNLMEKLGVAEAAVLCLSCIILISVGSYMFWESIQPATRVDSPNDARRKPSPQLTPLFRTVRIPPMISFPKSGIRVPFLFLAGVGLLTGMLAGSVGAGGGFLLVPSMIYLLGVPSYTAVGTDLFQMIFSAAFGSSRHILSGNVLVYVSLLTLLGSSVGVQIGVLATRYLASRCMRFVLANTILVAVTGSVLRLVRINLESPAAWLDLASGAVTFGGLAFIVLLIVGLLAGSARYRRHGSAAAFARYLYKEKSEVG